ncbi:MAG: deoxynucleoside kinase [Candidatus Sericytochromatia bacterium]|nr:deoxynucleoside kinase [Candidatus Sericytochromatia bacterium]
MSGLITVVGNIGAGKTSLTKALANELGWQAGYEVVQENPYLADFYGDMKRWSFHLQVYFLSQRFAQHQALVDAAIPSVQDRSVYEDLEIFCRALHRQGLLDGRDLAQYEDLHRQLVTLIAPPDLIIYLRSDTATLKRRIRQRNRDFEQTIDPGYLALLNELYEDWVRRIDWAPVLTIDSDGLDFVHNDADYRYIRDRIDQQLRPQRVNVG